MPATFGPDSRGAILVPAIVMGALLVGALFYVAAAGDAIIFRTQLQDAADTTAFTSAVWHARGMNVVAVINILMSLLLVVIVLFHVVELICLLVALIPPVTGVAMGVFRTLVQTEEKVSKGISTGLDVLQMSQQAVIVVVPYIAAVTAKRTPTAADTVWPGSMALLPVKLDEVMQQEQTRTPSWGPAALPVQDDEFGTLCARATMVIPEQVTGMIDRLADRAPFGLGGIFKGALEGVWNPLREQIETVAEAGDGVLCQPVNHIIAALAGKVASTVDEKVADRACGAEFDDQEKQAQEQQAQEQAASSGSPSSATDKPAQAAAPKEPTEQERKATARRKKKQVDGCASGVVDELSKSTEIQALPAMVWTAAANGNVFMHSWSRASGQPRLFNHDQRLIAMADRGRLPTVTPSTVALAEAEFYCDCEGKWSECQGDALWAPNWTARMRRFRWPSEELGKIGIDAVLNFGDVLKDTAFDQTQNAISQLIGKKSELAGDVIASFLVDNVMRKMPVFDQLAQKANDAISEGVEAAGLTDLFNPRDPDEKRVH